MATRMKNGNYLARVRMRNGKRLSETFTTKAEAIAWEQDQTITVGEFFISALDTLYDGCSHRKSVIKRILKCVEPQTPLIRVDQRWVTLLATALKKAKMSPSTINNTAASFNRIMDHARDLGLIDKVPRMNHLKIRNEKYRFLTEEEERILLEEVNEEDARLITLLIYSGLRWSETQRIRPDDYHKGNLTLWKTKAGKPRTIPLPNKARQVIEAGTKDLQMNYSTFRKRLTRAVKRAGLEGVTCHTLRHTTASRMVQKGVDLRRVRDYLGHSDIHTTMRYAHLAPGDLASAASALD